MSRGLLMFGFIFFICLGITIIGLAIYANMEQDKIDSLNRMYGVDVEAGEKLYLCDDGSYEVHNPAVPPVIFCGKILKDSKEEDPFNVNLGIS